MDRQLHKKMEQQYKLARQQRRLIANHLREMVDELENHPYETSKNRFPFRAMERRIHSGLTWIERKWLSKLWVRTNKRVIR